MKIKLLFFILLFSFIHPSFTLQADGLISSIYYEASPPVERGKKSIKKKKQAKKLKLKQKRKKKITQTKGLQKPGFLVMILGGILVGAFTVYIGSLITSWASAGGCSMILFSTLMSIFLWFGFALLVLITIALVTIGIIFTVYYNSPKYKGSPKKAKKEKKKAPQFGSHKF